MDVSPIRIGIAGTGYISRLFVRAASRSDEFEVCRVLTRRPLDSVTEFPLRDLLTNSLDELVTHADVVFECSGDPIHAFDVAERAVEAGLPVVTMNAEFHVTCGSDFVGRGLVTEAEGDQPGCLAELHERAVDMGFRPIVYGNMKGFLNLTPSPEEMEYWAGRQGISLPMVTASTDGTKVQFEQALVANCFGATIAAPGLLGLADDDLTEGGRRLAEHAERIGTPISDYLLSPSLGHGVFIVATHDAAEQDALRYYKLGEGPYYVLVKPNIFVHLEVLRTIRRAVREGRGLLDNSAHPTISIGAIAKRPIEAGTRIAHALGSFDVRGSAVRIGDAPSHVPAGLLANAVVRRGLSEGAMITFEDVELPESGALRAWSRIRESAMNQLQPPGPGPAVGELTP